LKRAIVLALAIVLGIAGQASAAPRFTRLEASHNHAFGSLILGLTEKGLLPRTRVRIVISAAERFKWECWDPVTGGPTDEEKYFTSDHLVIDLLEESNDQGQYRSTFDVGPTFARDVFLDRCAGDAYPILMRNCYSFITVLDIHREIGRTYPDKVCGKVTG
jgi:hypothetical protein